ncbi:MAG: AAA family ATPase [Thermodesulfobacteriota bacterium]
MLKRIKISGYKSLTDVEVRLQPLSVLFGPNGAGKSNFLDALQLLSKIATSRTLKDAFDPPYRGKPLESFFFGAEGIKGLLSAERSSFSIEVDVELSAAIIEGVNRQIREMKRTIPNEDDSAAEDILSKKLPTVREKNLRYRIEIEILPKSGILRVAEEYLAALNKDGEPTGKRQPFLSRKGNKLHLRMEGQAHPTYYERYLDHSILSLPNYPPHYPHLVAMRKELESWFFFYFEPRERMRAANPVKEVRHIGLMGEELASFLNTLQTLQPRQFMAVEKALHTIMPNVDGIDVGVNDLGEVELKLKENGVPMPARILSEGTLRILGLLALAGAKEQPALIGFEEPENGIHPRRIRMVADLLKTRASLGGTQYIVTTHSPLLPDLTPDESLFVCKKTGDKTSITRFTTWGPLGRRTDIDKSFDEEFAPSDDEELTPSERILRGDFDA